MPDYVGSRDWLDTMNRLWWLDRAGLLPPALGDSVAVEWARPLGTTDATGRYIVWTGWCGTTHARKPDAITDYPCTCAKCQKGPA